MIVVMILVAAFAVDVFVFWRLRGAFQLLKVPPLEELPADGDLLPSVSVCIPARNETHAMTDCLERVVSSDYPKLEIIVLDDGSRDDTLVLIKSFAHVGVRFIEGGALPDGWLGKNYAQSRLAREASGSVVFFMDVDTRITPYTISRAVAYKLSQKASMVSIIPQRLDTWRASTLFATMRHFWTVMRFRPSHPRAASNAWLIDRKALIEQLDNDTTLPRTVQLETTIARFLAQSGQYRLTLSNRELGISYEKKWKSQVETSIRLLYPQCDSHWYHALGMSLLLALPLAPYVLFWWQPLLSVLLILLQYLISRYYLSHIWASYGLIGALLLPVILAQEITLLFVSAFRYHFGTITWKGRPLTAAQKQATGQTQ